ncbi:hypothetical protein AGMMS50229_11480 [Campylobacterota bacterium]|nr:hypothetical protein AGMMS50229_11480 [Campylobacterota bacterium]
MIINLLQTATERLALLIETTKLDLTDIKAARHDELLGRVKAKEELVAFFLQDKTALDQAIAARAAANPNETIETLLTDKERELLFAMREKMEILHTINKRYASMVLAISDFYGSLLEALLPQGRTGYGDKQANLPSLLTVRG